MVGRRFLGAAAALAAAGALLWQSQAVASGVRAGLEACAAVRPNGYYASMAVAWAVSVCFAKYPEKTRPLLAEGRLDDETQNKAIQKIVDSFRVAEWDKSWVRTLRRPKVRKS